MDIKRLKQIREETYKKVGNRYTKAHLKNMEYDRQVLVCGSTGCASENSQKIRKRLAELVAEKGLNRVHVGQTGCFGLCAAGPVVVVYPDGTFYSHVKIADADEIVESHLINNKPVERLLYIDADGKSKPFNEIESYCRQLRHALRNCGVIDPENIDEYIARDGYFALHKAITSMSQAEVIAEVTKSGLRGRGGAGFLTGRKWEFTQKAIGNKKFVCCNADEGDPGAFMDRSILEGDPHAIIEAMAIAAYAVGADQGYVYVRAEYPIAVQRLQLAIEQARAYGLLGKNIFGTDFCFDLEIRLGAGAFVCGEETALMTSIEGHRGEPRPRPPFPAEKGLFGKPTLLNNVETYANIAQIVLNGADKYAAIGTEKSKGTKVFALGGKINNTGLVEIPMGTPLREIIYDIGGGIPNGKQFKAAQTGGPSGGCIPASLADTPIDYESLTAIGSMMGSGGLIVLDEDNCMVDIAKFYLQFTVDESCGKCTPCRIGTKRLYEMLCKVTEGTATMEDLDKMEELCYYIKDNSLCGLGQSAPNPVLSTLKYFREEYEAHVKEHRCPAGVCKSLLKYEIDSDKCKGCTLCARNCPANAISGELKAPHIIDTEKCVKCGLCASKCRFGAISKK